jgi:hypothetical protein
MEPEGSLASARAVTKAKYDMVQRSDLEMSDSWPSRFTKCRGYVMSDERNVVFVWT